MAALIFDAGGVVKRHVDERGSAWVQALADPAAGHEIFLTRIARVELTAVIARRGKGTMPPGATAGILTQFRDDIAHQDNILEVPASLLVEAVRLAELHALRGYDAVQPAASPELHQAGMAAGLGGLTLISGDAELNAAAVAQGVKVEDPNSHP